MTTTHAATTVSIVGSLNDEQIASYHTVGYVLLRGLIDPASAQALRDEVMGIMDAIGLPITNLKQTSEYLAGGQLEALIWSKRMAEIAGRLLGGRAVPYLPFTAVKSPGGGKFSFHQDNQYTRHDGPSLNMWCALEPMRDTNGCLRMLPRSHLNGTLASVAADDGSGHRRVVIEPERFVPIEMEPGDCVVFSRLTVHGSGANTSDTPRVGYAVQYHREDVKALWDDGWFPLIERPRFTFAPVASISRPKGKVDGH